MYEERTWEPRQSNASDYPNDKKIKQRNDEISDGDEDYTTLGSGIFRTKEPKMISMREKDDKKSKETAPKQNRRNEEMEPNSIISVKKLESGELDILMEWKARKDGVVPVNSHITGTQARKICPILLLDFYEERLKFTKK